MSCYILFYCAVNSHWYRGTWAQVVEHRTLDLKAGGEFKPHVGHTELKKKLTLV